MKSKILILVSLLFVMLTGCGKSASDARSSDDFAAMIQASPEVQALDASLDELESRTSTLTDSYNQVQGQILSVASFDEGSASERADKLVIYINENNVLIVNDTPMSRNDFQSFADKRLPTLCQPTPRLSIHKKADYDLAAWVLDSVYSHGCLNVSVE